MKQNIENFLLNFEPIKREEKRSIDLKELLKFSRNLLLDINTCEREWVCVWDRERERERERESEYWLKCNKFIRNKKLDRPKIYKMY